MEDLFAITFTQWQDEESGTYFHYIGRPKRGISLAFQFANRQSGV